MDKNLNFAILVDGENAHPKKYYEVLNEVSSKGSIAIKWVYADWTLPNHKGWKEIMLETGSAPKQQFHIAKDAADHALIMDAIELICTNDRINALCIVSSDGGFGGLAQRIREKGLHVMAIGRSNTPVHFRNACHDFIYVENLAQDNSEESFNDECEDSALDELLLKAFWQLCGDESSVYLGDLGTKLKQLDSAFDTRSYGYSSLKKLIQNKSNHLVTHNEQEDRCYIRLVDFTGVIKQTPKKGSNFAFLIQKGQEFYFTKSDLTNANWWDKITEGTEVTFNRASRQQGKSPTVTNVKVQ
ncbi:NYN domain-containing protein [Vibrio sp. TRT 1302]|uniref:NYN domain-containing protein n=1 Tax=Vibrio sp. TRT 1302 TaxID=3418504 RepID=UPI003CF5210F